MTVVDSKNAGAMAQTDDLRGTSLVPKLRIAYGVPEITPLCEAMDGQPSDATYLIQRHLVTRLLDRGHDLTFVGQRTLGQNVITSELETLKPAVSSWTGRRWFSVLEKATWRGQQAMGVPYLNVFTNLRLYDAARQMLADHDLIYERNGLYRTGLAMAARRLGIPYVLYIEADEILEHDFLGRPLTGLLRWRANQMVGHNLQAADRILCVSTPLKNHLAKKWSIPLDKILVFGNGVDVHLFRPRPDERASVRASFGIGEEPLLIFVGNFYAWHDVNTLLVAFARVIEAHPHARLLLVGDGDKKEEMVRQAADLGLTDAVQFTGRLPHADIPELIAAADIAVAPVPSMGPDFWLSPLKLYEYMASGTAIVASQIGQIDSFLRTEENGLLVRPGDAGALARSLTRLLVDPSLRRRLSWQARHDAVEYFSWDQYVDRLEQVFAAVVREKR